MRILLCQSRDGERGLEDALTALGHAVVSTGTPDAARDALSALDFAVVVVDLDLPGLGGLGFLREVRRHLPEVDIVVIASYDATETAVAAMNEGAADFVTKPFRSEELEIRIDRLRRLREQRGELGRLRAVLGEGACLPGLLSESPAMHAICERIRLAADTVAPVLLEGETGTGKELVARTIHGLGSRRVAPFVAFAGHRAATDELVATLLGDEQGGLGGAIGQADGGTLLVDDVDALCLGAQRGLCRLLEEGVVRRVNGSDDSPVDVRLVATTEVDLTEAVARGSFLDRLLRDLRGIEIRLPPLRERGDDVVLLGGTFLRLLAATRPEVPRLISRDAAELLRRHTWPGNVSELRRVIAYAGATATGGEITVADLPEALRRPSEGRPFTLHLEGIASVQLAELVHDFEQELRAWALEKAEGQPARAAEILGVDDQDDADRPGRN
ncbi:MAG: sigma-54-dependent Fis family transcriptional regulator [Deltaproteobacteria bacterium]|nr:sigma-54-dependent Fis family transcriptional regulator [Deltaproteobacteria bacterium]